MTTYYCYDEYKYKRVTLNKPTDSTATESCVSFLCASLFFLVPEYLVETLVTNLATPAGSKKEPRHPVTATEPPTEPRERLVDVGSPKQTSYLLELVHDPHPEEENDAVN